MANRALEIGKMMGYDNIDAILDAVGRGELILIKVPEEHRIEVSRWIRGQIAAVRGEDEVLADTLEDMAAGVDVAMELERYPADTDICEMDLPYGWPSYCDKEAISRS